ncbi:MAG: response regulator [Calditrichia bacterium]|nr:response regulator [Calditrichia bacterium]
MNNQTQSKILIVDDAVENIKLVTEILNRPKNEYHIEAAGDGYEALEKVKKFDPDLIMLDVVMPGIDGFEVCQILKEDEKTRLIPIVMITALDSQQDRLRGLESGVDDFISKPFNVYELLARVKNLLKLRSYISELEHAEQVIFSLARAVEAKDNYTEGHCERLSILAQHLGTELQLADEDLIVLKRGGILHDIGKIAIDDSILLKPGPLTAEEFEIIKTHPEIGENICRPLKTLKPVLPIIRYHQERFNGSGYPEGLAKHEIPIHARIIGLVDCYDALTTDRTYRKALPSDFAIQIMNKETEAGLWDPDLFKLLKEILASAKYKTIF